MANKICISVIGANNPTEDDAKMAREVGREIAKRGATLICGGLNGVMLESAKGAKDVGGITVGILPGDEPDIANPFIDIPIATGLGHARNVIVAYSGNAVIAVGGKLGTLSEIVFALLKEKPVIGINTWHLEKGRTYGNDIIPAKSAKEAVNKAFDLIINRKNETFSDPSSGEA